MRYTLLTIDQTRNTVKRSNVTKVMRDIYELGYEDEAEEVRAMCAISNFLIDMREGASNVGPAKFHYEVSYK